MRPAAFEYVAPREVENAVAALNSSSEAVALAGGQSLLPAMNRRQARPRLVVDLNGVTALDGHTVDGRGLRLGALTRHQWLTTAVLVRRRLPLLAAAAGLIGDPEVRRRGTLGGSLAYAQPGAELAVAAVLLQVEIELVGPGGVRSVPADQFFLGPFRTMVESGELVCAVRVEWTPPGEGWAVHKFNAQRHGHNVVAAVRIQRDSIGRCREARLVLGYARPIKLEEAAAELVEASDLSEPLLAAVTWRAVAEAVKHDEPVRREDRSLIGAAVARAVRAAWRNGEGVNV